MKDIQHDPVDHARTTRQHAGETMKDPTNAPGLIAVAIGVVAVVVGLFTLATGHMTVGIIAFGLGVIMGAAGLAWLAHTHRRVREAELSWHDEHSERPAPPPSS